MPANRLFAFLLALLLACASAGLRAQTAADPTVHQIYQKADSGDLRGARAMIDEVLAHHPGSAKAHYVKAELAARGGDAATARRELQEAEKLAPGLPFAKPEAVSALRAEVERRPAANRAPNGGVPLAPATVAAPAGGIPWGAVLLVGLLGLGVILWLRRPASLAPAAGPGPYARDDAFGRPDGMPPQPMPAGGYPMPQPQQPGMASTMMRGLGTGLAVGAGVVAAEEIGRRLFDHGAGGAAAGFGGYPPAADSQIARDAGVDAFDPGANQDMGGQDFGIVDGGGWDDGGAGDVGGNDWDN